MAFAREGHAEPSVDCGHTFISGGAPMTEAASRSREQADSCISCHIRSEWMQADAVEFRSILNRTFVSSENGRQCVATDAVFSAFAYRLDAHEPAKSRATAIYHVEGKVTWLDHRSRSFFVADVPRLPKKRASSTMLLLSPPERMEGKARDEFLAGRAGSPVRNATVLRTIVRDYFTRCDWTHYLICDPSLRVSRDVLKVFLTVLAGDPELQEQAGFPWDRLFTAVAEAGLPIAGGILPVDPAATTRRGSSFRIENIRLGPLSGGEFSIPDNYGPADSGDLQDTGPQIRMNSNPYQPGGLHVGPGYPTRNGDPSVPITVGNKGPSTAPGALPTIIGLLVPQSVLDSMKSTVNQLVLPLSQFSIGNGFLTLDWLAQMRSDWVARNGMGGTMLYCALHDEPDLNPGDPVPAECAMFSGKGLLDFQALQSAKDMVTQGTLPAEIVADLPAAVAAELATAGTNWSALSSNAKMRIACSVLWLTVGRIRIPINQPPNKPADPFTIDTPVASISIDQVQGTIQMPPVTRTSGPPVIQFRPLIATLACRNDATIRADVSLASIELQAGITVTPSAGFWVGVAVASVAALIFPPLGALSTIAAIAGVQVLAAGRNTLRVTCTNPTVSLNLGLRQNAQGLFGPTVTSMVSAEYAISLGPFSLAFFAGVFDSLVSAMQDSINGIISPILGQMITDQVDKALRGILGQGFPHAVTNLGIPVIGGSSGGAQNSHVYYEVALGLGPGFVPPLKPTPPINTEQAIVQDLSALLAGPSAVREREGSVCFSLNLSENAINDILAARCQSAFIPFDGAATQPADLQTLASFAQAPVLPSYFGWVVLDVLGPPVVTLSPASAAGYATIDVPMSLTALTVNPISAGTGPIPGATWTFHVSSPVKIVLGASLNESGGPLTPIVDLFQFPNHIFDVLIDMNNCGILVKSLSVTTGSPGGGTQSIPVTPVVSQNQEPLLRAALSIISGAFGLQREPHRDGIGAPPGDPGTPDLALDQTYTTDGSDPDAGGSAPPVKFPVALGLHPSLLHMHFQLAGAVTAIVDGTINVGAPTSTCSLGRAFQHSQQQVSHFLQQP